MKVSWQWLSQILDLSLTEPDKLAESLTALGLEVECIKISNVENTIFDVELTPNRNDLLNIVGVAREIAVVLRQKLSFKFCNMSFLSNKKNINKIKYNGILDNSHYLILLISNIKLGQSPKWMQDNLKLANVKPMNNVIDIRNYIKLKWGQSFAIFDVSKFYFCSNKNTIVIGPCVENSSNIDCSIPSIVVNDISVPSFYTNNVNASTHTILIQAAISHSLNWRKQSNTLAGKFVDHSENCDENILCYAIQETIFLYKKFCRGLVQGYQSWNLNSHSRTYVQVFKNNVVRILGSTVCKQKISEILSVLNLNPKEYPLYWLVVIPKYRHNDLRREIDIIEEIARIYGFHCFHDLIPKISIKNKISLQESLKRQIRSFLRSTGLHELIHSSLQKQQDISIYNPLSNDYNSLRSNIVPKLIQSLYYNTYQSNGELNGFEIGKVFRRTQVSNGLSEKLHLGIVWGCKSYLRSDWSNRPNAISWFQAKGMVSNLCYSIGLQLLWTKSQLTFDLKQILHNKRAAFLYSKQLRVGFFGEVNPQLCYVLGIKKKFYICELDLDTVIYQLRTSKSYHFKPYSRYPCVIRNISVLVPKNFSISYIMYKINDIKSAYVKSVEILDEYLGDQIPSGERNVNLCIKYQSESKTLTNTQIVQLDNYIKEMLLNKLNIKILS